MRILLPVLCVLALQIGCPKSDETPADVPDTVVADVPGADVADLPDAGLPDGACRRSSDCDEGGGWYCFAPGDPTPCGICRRPDTQCQNDQGCSNGEVCDRWDAPCKCTDELGCVPPCGDDTGRGCGAFQYCATDGHCVDQDCSQNACPVHFTCPAGESPTCVRKTCTTDDDCPTPEGTGACVNQTCRDSLGTCTLPVA